MPSIADIIAPVVGHIEVQRPVAIDIRQRHRRRPVFAPGARRRRGIDKFSVAVVQKAEDPIAELGDEQIEKSVAIDVGEDRAAIIAFAGCDPGFLGNVLESPVSEVLIERVMTVETAEVDVGQAIVIKIAYGDARSVVKDSIGRTRLFLQ